MPQSAESQRFEEIFRREGWNQTDLAKELGYDHASIVNIYLKGERKIADSFLFRLENKMGVSKHYIRTGQGPERIAKSDMVSAKGKAAYDELLQIVANGQTSGGTDQGLVNESDSKYNGQFRGASSKPNMWIVPPKAQAGFINGFIGRLFAKEISQEPFPDIQGECFQFTVEGSSMIPEYMPGDKIVCTILNDISWLRKNKIYVFQLPEGLIIKHYMGISKNKILIKSSNNSFNPTDPLSMSEVQVIYNIDYGIIKK